MDCIFWNPERVARFTKECLVTDFGIGASGQNIKYMVFIFMDVVQCGSIRMDLGDVEFHLCTGTCFRVHQAPSMRTFMLGRIHYVF